MSSNDIALLCQLFPASKEKQQRLLSLLQEAARGYYRRPSSKCTTWSYFLPHPPPKKEADAPLVLAGLEIYTEKNALQKQLDDVDFFQRYHEICKKEGLLAKEDELVAWYFMGGFVAREKHAEPFGGNLVSLSKIAGNREEILKLVNEFVPFVRDQEPDVLTYAIFTRPKAPQEVLLFVRYRDSKALKSHINAPEHTALVKAMNKHVGTNTANLWREVEDSFVSTVEGGPSQSSKL